MGFGLTEARTKNEPEDGRLDGFTVGLGSGAVPEPDTTGAFPPNWTARTGCSSMALGATPDCPCGKSKKPTPITAIFVWTWCHRSVTG